MALSTIKRNYMMEDLDLAAVSEEFFVSSAAYTGKMVNHYLTQIHEVVVAINNTQFLFGGGTWTGLIRFREYIINDPVREQHNMVPEEYFPVKAYQNISDEYYFSRTS